MKLYFVPVSSNAPPALQVALRDLQAPPPQFGNQPTSGLDGKGKGSRGGRARIAGGVSRDVGFTRLRLCARDPAPVAGYVSNVKGREVSICLLRLGYIAVPFPRFSLTECSPPGIRGTAVVGFGTKSGEKRSVDPSVWPRSSLGRRIHPY